MLAYGATAKKSAEKASLTLQTKLPVHPSSKSEL
jgi:hypothetical protein